MARKAVVDDLEALDLEDDFEVIEEEEAKAKRKGSGKAKVSKPTEPQGIGPRELAEHLGTDPKQFRAWLRRQLAAGKFPELEHDHKTRYHFGDSVNSKVAVRIATAWTETSNERGEGLKEARAAKAAEKAAAKAEAEAKAEAKPKTRTKKASS